MKKLISHDALTGVKTYHEYDHSSGNTHITESQDAQKVLDYTKRLANDPSYKAAGIKSDWYHFATVPNNVIVEIKTKHGLDIFKNEDMPKIERLLQSEYRKLLTVNRI